MLTGLCLPYTVVRDRIGSAHDRPESEPSGPLQRHPYGGRFAQGGDPPPGPGPLQGGHEARDHGQGGQQRHHQGDVLAAARVAGIQAAKRTADLVPMCHPLLVGAVHVDFTIGDDYVEVEAKVEAVDRPGWRWRR